MKRMLCVHKIYNMVILGDKSGCEVLSVHIA